MHLGSDADKEDRDEQQSNVRPEAKQYAQSTEQNQQTTNHHCDACCRDILHSSVLFVGVHFDEVVDAAYQKESAVKDSPNQQQDVDCAWVQVFLLSRLKAHRNWRHLTPLPTLRPCLAP